ncbi:MAG: LacI family DNA-binding transcriptional regulator [Pseudomonadota bacterium]
MDRPTVHDLARHAKVSLATIDRVLNGRPGVRDKTVARVQKAIEDLGYARDANAATLARKKPYRFVFLLPKAETQFMSALIAAIRDAEAVHAALRAEIVIIQASMLTPEEASNSIRSLDAKNIDGLAIMAPETPTIRDAVIKLRSDGVPVVPIITDLPDAGCGHFVGTNNIAAGRTAARLLGGFIGPQVGSIAVIGGQTMSRNILDRRLGFDQVMGERYPRLRILPTAEGLDNANRVKLIAQTLLERHDDLVGIYMSAGGTRGLHAALKEHEGALPRVVVQDLTPIARHGLEANVFDAVIGQDLGHVARSAVRVMRSMKDQLPLSRQQERIRIEVFTSENLPDP